MNEIKTIDLFSGTGGIRKAQDDLNEDRHHLKFRCVWSCDNDKYANRVYRKQYGEESHYPGDIKTVDAESIPDFDLLNAGFPCPAFSSAGKRAGFQDPRGALFFEICRIAEVKRPKMLFLENVEGIRWHDEGRTQATIFLRLGALGYNVGYQVFNSRFHGVAQDRARCFFIAVLREGGPQQILPLIENDRISTQKREPKEVVEAAQSFRGRDYANYRGNFILAPPLAATITAGEKAVGLNSNMTLILDGYNKSPQVDDQAGALRTNPHNKEEKRSYSFSDIARALTGPWGNQSSIIVEMLTGRLRRFTPIEEERLQGFPDNWTSGGIDDKGREVKISDFQRYKMMGNAVTVNVVREISWFIREAFYSQHLNKQETKT